jgi:hypothetical protein
MARGGSAGVVTAAVVGLVRRCAHDDRRRARRAQEAGGQGGDHALEGSKS